MSLRISPTIDSPANPDSEAGRMQLTPASDAVSNTEKARKRAFEEFQPETSTAEQPPTKRTRCEQWTSQENALFRLIPQLSAARFINPFGAVEIVVQWREGDETISFHVPCLVLIKLSSKFKELLSGVGPDRKIHWQGIHPQAVAQIIEFGHSDSGIFGKRECRTLRQVKQQFPAEFMAILSDMVKLVSQYDIDDFRSAPLLHFIGEEINSDSKENLKRYFEWGRENPAQKDVFDSVLETMMQFGKNRGRLCAGLSFIFNSDYSHLKAEQQAQVRDWIRKIFWNLVSKVEEELNDDDDEDVAFETAEIFKCLVDLYPRLDFPEGLLEILSCFPVQEGLEVRSDSHITGISESDPIIYVIRFCEIYRYYSRMLDFSDGREIPINPALRVPDIYSSKILRRYRHLFEMMKLPFGQPQQLERLNSIIQNDPENVFALKFRALIWRSGSNFLEAVRDFNKVLEHCPLDTLALRNRAWCHFLNDDLPASVADLDRLISLNSDDGKSRLLRAEIYFSTEQFDEALNELRIAIKNLAPVSTYHLVTAYYLKGKCLKKLGEGDKAIAALSKSLSIDPDHVASLEVRGRIYLEFKGDVRLALNDFDRLVNLAPGYPPAFVLRATCFKQKALELRRKRIPGAAETAFNAALTDFSFAIQIGPNYPGIFILRGEMFEEWGMLNEAIEDFNQALALSPNNLSFILRRADCLLRSGNMQEAWNGYIHAIRIDPNHPDPYYGLAEFYEKFGEQEKQLEQLNQALAHDGEHLLALIKRARYYVDSGEMEKAFADLDQAVKSHPLSAEAIAHRGRWYDVAENHLAAVEDLDRAIALDPMNDEFYRMRADAYINLLDFEAALSDYNRAIELNPENPTALAARGDCYFEMENFEQGIRDLDRSIELNPDFHYSRFVRGFYYANVNQHEKALVDLTQMIEMAPDDIQGYIMRGESYRALGRIDEAIADFNAAIDIEKSAPLPHAYIAACYMKKGNFYRARRHIERALELKPDFEYAQRIKEEIEREASKKAKR